MSDSNWLQIWQQHSQLEKLQEMNSYTERYGLALTEEETKLLLSERNKTLKEQRRVEIGPNIIQKIIYEFCDSAYIDQDNYVSMLIRLQDIFFLYKNEMNDEISDDELLHFMKEQFETICYGDLEYLEGTCLANFAQAIRAGYEGYQSSDGYGVYANFDEVCRWDRELFLQALNNLW